ncbi:Very long-chain acyl-CoA synthetase-like [Phytophthora palmivora]|uniref:Very long-chain acyl-CoA synthetase-like n=1 Tax=Phytophthora palmivora TaxID=4796 RepID=A0A2P4X471_9STRA|nr:Very long-chain acyl-CoA synthetase-like [Phytophthora palmivora]
MRYMIFITFVVCTFVGSCFNIAGAKEEVTITLLDDVVSKVEPVVNKKNWDIVKYNHGTNTKNLDTASTVNLKATNLLKKVDEVQAAKIPEAVAKEGSAIKSFKDIWKNAIFKVKVVNALNPAKLRGQTTSNKGWETAATKLNGGGQTQETGHCSFWQMEEFI